MNKIFSVYYVKYNKFGIPAVFLLLSTFLLFRVILPQLSSISDIKNEISDKNAKVSALNTSLSAITGQSGADIDSVFSTTTHALPNSKDIALIFTSLSGAASNSDTSLQEFSLKVGSIYGKAADTAVQSTLGTPSVSVRASVSGSPDGILKFTEQVQKQLPLAEITSIDSNGDLATFQISFFYKPTDLARVAKQNNVTPLTQSQLNLLNQLKTWEK